MRAVAGCLFGVRQVLCSRFPQHGARRCTPRANGQPDGRLPGGISARRRLEDDSFRAHEAERALPSAPHLMSRWTDVHPHFPRGRAMVTVVPEAPEVAEMRPE